ncbi:doublesex- and mab-3-related transcription factor B1-like [Lampris incognitus]|uniref:doublesex- and mab-3-related transcription factor B1-like n=1 Tax=Lampris incognitus TaxID=2546036 RepID=UPI0024B4C22B|nr:doublesex- and mab-3-related transcription factor B1-like [Lampris incognitus]
MSASKERTPTALRQPKCARCRHHGFVVPQKGHMKNCPFVDCICWKCYLVTQRTKIMALQRRMKRSEMVEVECVAVGDVGAAAAGAPCAPSPPRLDPAPQTPPQRFETADGKTYAELQGVKSEDISKQEGKPSKPLSPPDLPRRPVYVRDLPYLPKLGQTHLYNAEMLAVPSMGYPVGLFARHPSDYPHSLAMNRAPMPPGPYKDGQRGSLFFPHFQTGTRPYPSRPDPRGFFHAPYPSMYPMPYPGELMQPQPQPFPKDKEHGTATVHIEDGPTSLSSKVLGESSPENSTGSSSI